jgi:hypothetical protein
MKGCLLCNRSGLRVDQKGERYRCVDCHQTGMRRTLCPDARTDHIRCLNGQKECRICGGTAILKKELPKKRKRDINKEEETVR